MDLERKSELVRHLVQYLVEDLEAHGVHAPVDIIAMAKDPDATYDQLWLAFRALVNMRPAWPAAPEFLDAQDELLRGLIEEAGIHPVEDAQPSPRDPRMRLWRGDITTLAVDAIVNAANSGMTGCWQPLHYCIDNAIHTFAGVQLRAHMAAHMEEQGHEEETGQAYVSPAYNLPARHVIHTVGPIAAGFPTDMHRALLARCYRSCLDAAQESGCESIAFCCISTGAFGFPQQEAAQIAVRTVDEWVEEHPESSMTMIFDVFGKDDEAIYRELLDL